MGLGNPEFQLEFKLVRLCRDIINGDYNNEAEVRSEFTRTIRNYLEDNPKLKGIKINEEVTIIDGRIDARIGKFVIEFESPIKNKKLRTKVSDPYIKKIKTYIQNLKEEGFYSRGIVTNGVELVFVDEDGEIVERGSLCEI